ncbi:MAG: cupin domain-containing protein [Chloroflexi bacterium]|nr:cupin domain-containing protein [Chloroflexota bacterium]
MLVAYDKRAWSRLAEETRCSSKDLVTSVETKALRAHHLKVEPGGEMRQHSHDTLTEMHFVSAGHGEISIQGIWNPVCAGDVVLVPPGVPHGARNNTDEPLFLLCVFSPPLV